MDETNGNEVMCISVKGASFSVVYIVVDKTGLQLPVQFGSFPRMRLA